MEHDGLIAHVFTRDLAEAPARLGKPVVNVSGVLPDLAMPRVMADHEQVGRLAAAHFPRPWPPPLGFFGYTAHAFSIGREAGFRREAVRAGCRVESYLSDDPLHPEPTGLWRWDDGLQQLARRPAQARRRAGQPRHPGRAAFGSLPPDGSAGAQTSVALLGVDDDDLFCEVARPSLSSVALPGERIGFEAARMLEALLSGQRRRTSSRTLLLPSPGVVTRQSSDMMATEDEDVAAAVRFIRATPTGRSGLLTCSVRSPSPGGRWSTVPGGAGAWPGRGDLPGPPGEGKGPAVRDRDARRPGGEELGILGDEASLDRVPPEGGGDADRVPPASRAR